ncbi:MAG TPA: Xaa-Pro peptidase family protein [bacterium]|nr:Xaa-Pro peptidase family protein [bacterium]
MTSVYEERMRRLWRSMQDSELAAFVVTSPTSIYYLTGLTPSAPPGLVVTSRAEAPPLLVVRGIELKDVQQVAPFPVSGAPFGSTGVDLIAEAVREVTRNSRSRVGFDEEATLSTKLLEMEAAMPWVKLVPSGGLIMDLRFVKTPEEVAMMQRAAEVSDRAMLAAVEAIRDGRTEAEAAAAAETTWRSYGLGPAYDVLIGSGKRSAALRRFPSLIVPPRDDLVRFDFAARLSPASGFGYNNDMTRTFTPGKPSPANEELLRVGVAVFEATLNALRPGRTIGDVAEEGLREVKGTRYEVLTHMVGHGIGADVHEPPPFARGSTFVIQPGNCFAIEPMVCLPGERAVCFENTVVIKEDGWGSLNQLDLRLWGT